MKKLTLVSRVLPLLAVLFVSVYSPNVQASAAAHDHAVSDSHHKKAPCHVEEKKSGGCESCQVEEGCECCQGGECTCENCECGGCSEGCCSNCEEGCGCCQGGECTCENCECGGCEGGSCEGGTCPTGGCCEEGGCCGGCKPQPQQ